MKFNRILSASALLAIAGTASADQTIEITGATAFRVGAVKAIVALYGAGLQDVAHTSTSTATNGHEGANDAIFRGTIADASLPGTTVIRCSWSGSVEGINALVNSAPELYLPVSAFGAGTSYAGPGSVSNVHSVVTAQVADTESEIAFSDVFGSSTPYDTTGFQDTIVGVLPFFAVINEGNPVEFTNMTAQKWGQLLDAGFLPANYIFPTSETFNVYATGRNDGSGTRTHYLAISRGGPDAGTGRNQVEKGNVSGVVQQWRPDALVGNTIPAFRPWPTGDGANVSTVWGNNAVGNGGYASGSTVANRLGGTSNPAQRQNAAGVNQGAPVRVAFVSIVGLSDAVAAQTAGARVLAWDGVPVTVTATLAASELAKFYDGSYTNWSYEHQFGRPDLDAGEQYVYDQLVANIPTFFGTSGIDESLMTVKRNDDGTDVIPK